MPGPAIAISSWSVHRLLGLSWWDSPSAPPARKEAWGPGSVKILDLPGEMPGLIPTTAWKRATIGESWQKGETLVCGIGQGYVSATPLQLAIMAALNFAHEQQQHKSRADTVSGDVGQALARMLQRVDGLLADPA